MHNPIIQFHLLEIQQISVKMGGNSAECGEDAVQIKQ
jgi:hypothetical protein